MFDIIAITNSKGESESPMKMSDLIFSSLLTFVLLLLIPFSVFRDFRDDVYDVVRYFEPF